MNHPRDIDPLYAAAPRISRFEEVGDAARYLALPGDWFAGVADVVDSTAAIAAGRYKAVNLVGAGVIAAVRNACGGARLPFAFGGDGASFAVPGAREGAARGALAACVTWAREEIGFGLRAALVPVQHALDEGFELRVARFEAAPGVDYALFSGGGAAFAEAEMRAGRFGVEAAPPGTRPDLAGLSCRWSPIPATKGEVLSILALPREGAGEAFAALVRDLARLLAEDAREGHPVPEEGPRFGWPEGAGLEHAATRSGTRPRGRARVLAEGLLAWGAEKLGARLGRFDPAGYRRGVARNADFRKYDDGLKLTVDCSASLAARIEARLERAVAEGVADYGLHGQDSALMTCLSTSLTEPDGHLHFVDGSAGGYAAAATKLKVTRAANVASIQK